MKTNKHNYSAPHTPQTRYAVVWVCAVIAVGIIAAALSPLPKNVLAYYTKTGRSLNNVFTAALLDIEVPGQFRRIILGFEEDEQNALTFTPFARDGSGAVQYRVETEYTGGDEQFCQNITVSAPNQDDSPLLSFTLPPRELPDMFDLGLSLSGSSTAGHPHGTECIVDLVFTGWSADIPFPFMGGYTDQERVQLIIANHMIVLNEFLPNPDNGRVGTEEHRRQMADPHGEWIELYNNSSTGFDVFGWSIEDAAGSQITVSPANTDTGSTIVPPSGWLVVVVNDNIINNSGDSLTLRNTSGTAVDSFAFISQSRCSPGNEGLLPDSSGICDEILPNRSYARIPDGVGTWLQSVLTPGKSNTRARRGPDLSTGSHIQHADEDASSDATSSEPSQTDVNRAQASSSTSTTSLLPPAQNEGTSTASSTEDTKQPQDEISTTTDSSMAEPPEETTTASSTDEHTGHEEPTTEDETEEDTASTSPVAVEETEQDEADDGPEETEGS